MLGLGKVGAMQRGTSSEQNIDIYFLILLLERKIQGGVFTVLFMKQREFFSDNSEMRLPVREQPLSLLLAPWHPQESWPTCSAALGRNRTALGTENMSSDFGWLWWPIGQWYKRQRELLVRQSLVPKTYWLW